MVLNPALVIYTGQNSIEVTPDEQDVLSKNIRKRSTYRFNFL